ncbi:thioredoxin family protein [Fulvivirga sp. RKSG066]|uniref:thioredoxin family protein n=1 Tax=Fulvivirga aurantia TaxID=2529383 RepID=UPI0012BB59CE|nr:thioredoxin family protein [Fulvivirga aurantia]MTI20744.1 thioredoxin family protein [Fulvivirga aurantia]
MSLTPSNMLPLETEAPSFNLPDAITERNMSLEDIKGETATVIMFICNHCPYVKHVQPEIVKLAEDYIPEGVKFAAISSNDVENYPEDSPELMKEEAKKWGYAFPYLYDETQAVARAYDAACTPDFYVFDKDLKLVYRGQLDESRPGNEKELNGKDLRNALDDLLKGNPITEDQIPSQGCNIKWKK